MNEESLSWYGLASPKGPIVPTTTPPLVWPSNGKNKGGPTTIFTSYTYGGFDIM